MDHSNYLTILNYFNDRVKSGAIKQSTLNTAMYQLRKVNKDFGLQDNCFHTEIYAADEAALLTDYFKSYDTGIQRRLRAFLQCYKILEINPPKYLLDIKDSYLDVTHKALSGAPKKSLNFFHFGEVIDVYKKYAKKINSINVEDITHEEMTNFLYIAFYTLIPPMRPSELINLKIIKELDDNDDKIDGNYLVIDDKTMYFTDYKTSKAFGNVELIVPDELIDILNKFYHKLKIVDGYKYLFVGKNKIIADDRFSGYFKKIEGLRNTTSTDLRNLYVSTVLNRASAVERANASKYMLHSISMQQSVYSKYDKDRYPDPSAYWLLSKYKNELNPDWK